MFELAPSKFKSFEKINIPLDSKSFFEQLRENIGDENFGRSGRSYLKFIIIQVFKMNANL